MDFSDFVLLGLLVWAVVQGLRVSELRAHVSKAINESRAATDALTYEQKGHAQDVNDHHDEIARLREICSDLQDRVADMERGQLFSADTDRS